MICQMCASRVEYPRIAWWGSDCGWHVCDEHRYALDGEYGGFIWTWIAW